jgi:hypothetical protein
MSLLQPVQAIAQAKGDGKEQYNQEDIEKIIHINS